MAGRPNPDATNKSSHMRCPSFCNGFARMGLELCQKIGRGMAQTTGALTHFDQSLIGSLNCAFAPSQPPQEALQFSKPQDRLPVTPGRGGDSTGGYALY